MIQLTKELAEAVVKSNTHIGAYMLEYCSHCGMIASDLFTDIQHTPECIVTRAKLLLELEWGIKS